MLLPIPQPVTVLVTGTDEGLGYEAARRLTVERLVKDGADPMRLDVNTADFVRLSEVARMARQMGEAADRVVPGGMPVNAAYRADDSEPRAHA